MEKINKNVGVLVVVAIGLIAFVAWKQGVFGKKETPETV